MRHDSRFYFITLCISLIVLLIEVIFRIKGIVGLVLCLSSVYFIVGLIIKLLRIAEVISDDLLEKIDILFFLWVLKKYILK